MKKGSNKNGKCMYYAFYNTSIYLQAGRLFIGDCNTVDQDCRQSSFHAHSGITDFGFLRHSLDFLIHFQEQKCSAEVK